MLEICGSISSGTTNVSESCQELFQLFASKLMQYVCMVIGMNRDLYMYMSVLCSGIPYLLVDKTRR